MKDDDQILPGKLLKNVANELLRHYEAILRPYGLGAAGAPVLYYLSMGIANTQSALAELTHVEQPSMAQCLARLERDGLIVRVASHQDKRVREIQLTDTAKAIVPDVAIKLSHLNDRILAGFSPQETTQLRHLLKRILHNLLLEQSNSSTTNETP
ncbi:MarR family transcriptional regulator [Shewanella sp. A3A]|uniref:MarR family transcriptional regulator n=1 Tax=Shewanella electrica TaxID=515560 RepID=A0ABT2FHS7_9GAMM|nr:MarR family transcriptional regulator [Shewanella electrica]MCH1918486.1 MarR family transcriptional regulator [Shewanella ferrihydritica]MCH1925355.1 MarR family transcriptional regulator [Shewanella electrica]MCS4555180.1 MarR family transcriptional regulator [Shewanella electrica]